MVDLTGWDVDAGGIPTFFAAQQAVIATVPGADGGIVKFDYATTEANALAGVFESIQLYFFKDQAEALARDFATLAEMSVGKAGA